jgi:alpha-ketoglutaric semialdehyde dehydrogenase
MDAHKISAESAPADINACMTKAAAAAIPYSKMPALKRAAFLDDIAKEIESKGDELIHLAQEETHIPVAQLQTERARTINQLRLFADMIRDGSWVDARIDTAIADRKPFPKNDLRSMLVPLGPVVVFGASNFPFAYARGCAGCPVLVKAHPAHPRASSFVAALIARAAENTGMPNAVFQHIVDADLASGQALVTHPLTCAVGFTGSYAGGKALFDLAQKRQKPIPVFSEMGSANPVCILPETLKNNAAALAVLYAKSITTGMGQFCTKPGLQIVPDNEDLANYLSELSKAILQVPPAQMLHPGIASAYEKRRSESLRVKGLRVEATVPTKNEQEGSPTLASVSAKDFLKHPVLHTEVFGPYSLVIRCIDRHEMLSVIHALEGQLTATIMGTEAELENNLEIIEAMKGLAGRIIVNGVPTGVEVCPSMVHGGPFPATTDSRFTAVGLSAVRRFLRPVCFQNFPASLLPEELKNENPRKIWRLLNNRLTQESFAS